MNEPQLTLALIDPGLRKTPFFLEFRRMLPANIRCVYYSRRFIVRGYIRSVRAPLYPAACSPLPARAYDIGDAALDRAIGAKARMLRGEKLRLKARRLLADISAFLDANGADAVLVWNGSKLCVSLGAYLARQRGLPVLFAEHGYLPGTLQIDLRGVNYDNSVTPMAFAGEAELPPDPMIDAALDREISAYKAGAPMRVYCEHAPRQYRASLRTAIASRVRGALQRLSVRHARFVSRRLGLDRVEALPARFVLLPMQVRKDSQLLLHSPVIGNDLEQLIGCTHSALRAIDPGLKLVVKLHPYERKPAQYRNLALLKRYPDVVFMAATPIRQLLAQAEAVVTINSTVGFEAFLYDKPVVTLGLNFYTVPGLVHPVGRIDELPAVLADALNTPVDRQRRRAFLRYVYAHVLTFGSYHDFSERSLQAVAERVLSLLPAGGRTNAAHVHHEEPAPSVAASPQQMPASG